MGFLSRVIGTAVGNIVSGEISKAINSGSSNSNSNNSQNYNNNTPYNETPIPTGSQNPIPASSQSFSFSGQTSQQMRWNRVPVAQTIQKFIQESNGRYTAQTGIPAELFEQQCGQAICSRGRKYKAPDPIGYLLFDNGMPALFIRTWDSYPRYHYLANRQIKDYSDSHGIKMIDFFEYLPNDEDYVFNRLRQNL